MCFCILSRLTTKSRHMPPVLCLLSQFEFKKPATCRKVCTKTYDTKTSPADGIKLDFLKKGMLLNYQHHWCVTSPWCTPLTSLCKGGDLINNCPTCRGGKYSRVCCVFRIVDNMPVTWCYDVEDGQKFCNPGFPIGCYVTETRQPKDACVVNVSSSDSTWWSNIQ